MRLPAAYTLLRAAGVRAAVRRDLAGALGPWLLAPRLRHPPGSEPVRGGRGAAYRTTLPGGVRAVVRPYMRGGLVARVSRDTFLGPRPRPWRELLLTVAAHDRGVAVPDVLAARVEGGWLGYRGTFVTAELPDVVPLIDALRATRSAEERQHTAELAGVAVGTLHQAGVWHADLNLTNVLVPAAGHAGTARIVDLDRARLCRAPLGLRARRRNLRRLARSVRKLDPDGRIVDEQVRRAFCVAYGRTVGPCAS